MLGSIRTYFFEKEKKKRTPSGIPVNTGFQLNRKNHFGLLIDAADIDNRSVVSNFAEELRRNGNRVKILGFIDGKMEGMGLSFDVITSADLTRVAKIPKSLVAESFMEQPFDILINLSIHQNHKALEYIASVSKASFKVGSWYQQLGEHPYDLCVDAGTASLKEWIEELMTTLQKIY